MMTETQDVVRVLSSANVDMNRMHLDPNLEAKRQKAIQWLRTKSSVGWWPDRKVSKDQKGVLA